MRCVILFVRAVRVVLSLFVSNMTAGGVFWNFTLRCVSLSRLQPTGFFFFFCSRRRHRHKHNNIYLQAILQHSRYRKMKKDRLVGRYLRQRTVE